MKYNGYVYASLEEAYQTSKFVETAPEIAEQIKQSNSAHDAQKIAFANKLLVQPDWDSVKLSIMEQLLRLKLKQNPYVKQKLLETKDYQIVEDSPKDAYWDWGPNRDGQKQLGKLWMKLRAELQQED